MEQASALVEYFMNILGQSKADAERNAALQIAQQGYRDWTNITAPELKPLDLQQQGATELGGITEDPRLRDYQMQALDALGSEVSHQGMTPEDMAAFQRARGMAGSVDAGLRGAAEQQAAARGMGSSTGAYLGALSSGQAGVNRASEMGTQAAADARSRYLQALDQLGGQSAGVRGQDYGIARNRAEAQDAINRFNTGMKWQNAQYNQGLAQQMFDNAMGLARGRMGASMGMADLYNQRGDNAEKTAAKWGAGTKNLLNSMWGGMGGWGGGGGGE